MAPIRRATVFGGTGFIGRYIVKRLAQRGATVIVVGRHAWRGNYLQPMGDVGQIALVDGDIRDDAVVSAAVQEADLVVNLVGILAESGRQRFEAVQHEGAGRIARTAAAAGARHVLHVSAIGADPASPAAYGRSKAAGEAAVRAACPGAVILRPSIVFGPEDQFFNRFAAMTRLSPFLPLIGGGRTKFQPVYVGDVADAAMAAIDEPAAAGQTYELGGPTVYTFEELIRLMLREIGRPGFPLVPIPFGLATLQAAILEHLPGQLLTRDQVKLLKRDNVVSADAKTLADLGITPTAPEVIIESYLERFRTGGRHAGQKPA
ncbi:3-beta-hydroxy-Delta(5)-steroid dehydrogenase [Aliidongia dinghuensis]|uniref:3-beta-hydroxy-Delta(5)-steroid dehydrogenase n=1 Tax=Aliidongia dinghuensis TaxID=1867774 RepID=A0A8J2YS57_9PROT|nr:complex I NDUFA9 subunit family protein [Aliidongia dinghuensis]GGF08904.1 3-beta-hydroxy-Delta(5)-steroid dehydrogenase [Aliidongia dinghuensis]